MLFRTPDISFIIDLGFMQAPLSPQHLRVQLLPSHTTIAPVLQYWLISIHRLTLLRLQRTATIASFKQYWPSPNNPPHQCFTNIISELENCKSSSDRIATYLRIKPKHLLCPPLPELINWYLKKGVFPDILNIAHVTPIFKSGDRCDPNNYRSITVLPVVTKVFEKSMYKTVMNLLEKYQLLSHQQ